MFSRKRVGVADGGYIYIYIYIYITICFAVKFECEMVLRPVLACVCIYFNILVRAQYVWSGTRFFFFFFFFFYGESSLSWRSMKSICHYKYVFLKASGASIIISTR